MAYTNEERDFIKANASLSDQQLAELFSSHFAKQVSVGAIRMARKRTLGIKKDNRGRVSIYNPRFKS